VTIDGALNGLTCTKHLETAVQGTYPCFRLQLWSFSIYRSSSRCDSIRRTRASRDVLKAKSQGLGSGEWRDELLTGRRRSCKVVCQIIPSWRHTFPHEPATRVLASMNLTEVSRHSKKGRSLSAFIRHRRRLRYVLLAALSSKVLSPLVMFLGKGSLRPHTRRSDLQQFQLLPILSPLPGRGSHNLKKSIIPTPQPQHRTWKNHTKAETPEAPTTAPWHERFLTRIRIALRRKFERSHLRWMSKQGGMSAQTHDNPPRQISSPCVGHVYR